MVVDPATRRSAFDALKAPPKAATLGRFKERLQYMLELDRHRAEVEAEARAAAGQQ